ncbi:DUF4253 domain-containing protein [Streptomyces sp. WMMC940]|uniref:DUF4253 domain-containing protein n=1 Tax=Streptomyces sp. WMMC940 TaxID=3015153 RepID=UPI0022B61096|nr:DUF4253 domain-containing protein [Streptomyces sp. WMMC940]MCZ7458724.1 DUF4253 domain-containing protein [Streptomyces sp. WMMC940]
MAMLPNPLPALATDPTGRTLGLDLPPGRLVDTTVDGPWHEPLLWYGDEPAAPGAWDRLLPARRAGGLHPLLIGGDGGPHEWELAPQRVSYPGDHDAEEVLAEFWDSGAAEESGADADWPGLAAGGALVEDPDRLAAEAADALSVGAGGDVLKGARPALVRARRSADIPAAIGWSGPLDHEGDVARLCSVLRSWEDRFGIRVVGLSFDRLVLSVAAPPTRTADAEALAAEHLAFCPDSVRQGPRPGLRSHAQRLLGAPVWTFSWD